MKKLLSKSVFNPLKNDYTSDDDKNGKEEEEWKEERMYESSDEDWEMRKSRKENRKRSHQHLDDDSNEMTMKTWL